MLQFIIITAVIFIILLRIAIDAIDPDAVANFHEITMHFFVTIVFIINRNIYAFDNCVHYLSQYVSVSNNWNNLYYLTFSL